MKKVIMIILSIILSIISVSGLFGCSKSNNEPYVVNTFDETSEELIDAYRGLSSNMSDYFKVEDAVIVGIS